MPKLLPSDSSGGIEDVLRFAKVRLIALDVDGTLLRHSIDDLAQIVASINRQLRFGAKSVRVTIATGRALCGARRVADALDSRRAVPSILYNGAVIAVIAERRSVRHFGITRDDVVALLASAASAGGFGLAYSIGKPLLTDEPDPIVETVWGFTNKSAAFVEEVNGLAITWLNDPNEYAERDAVAVLIQVDEPRLRQRLLAELRAFKMVTTTSSGASYVEVRPRSANKGVALATLASTLEVEQDEVLALGDNDNDVEMLQWAGIGVAVGNTSSQAALDSADYICRHGSMSAAVEVLRLVKHAKRFARSSLLRVGLDI